MKNKNTLQDMELSKLISTADVTVLRKLLHQLLLNHPDLQSESIDYLMKHLPLKASQIKKAATAALFMIWKKLEPILDELEAYGGGIDEFDSKGYRLLEELSDKLTNEEVPREKRRGILDKLMKYIERGNSGLEDALYETAYTSCHDSVDLRYLAKSLAALGKDYPASHAMKIYRLLGDRQSYLALRTNRLTTGSDYYDLVTFYLEAGEQDKALEYAWIGLKNATGRRDDLLQFLSNHADEAGDRNLYLELQFTQATGRLTPASYSAFKKICSDEEWAVYEPKMLALVEQLNREHRLEIYMLRREYAKAAGVLGEIPYPDVRYDAGTVLKMAAQLEKKFPDVVLDFYMKGLGNINQNQTRQVYAGKAKVAGKIRHMWVEVLKTPEKWDIFAKQIKSLNYRRPSFQEQFARVIPGWKEL